MLLTSNRLESGKILVNLDFFEIKGNMKINLKIPDEKVENMVYGKLDMDNKATADKSFRDFGKSKNIVIGVLVPGEEPSKHTLNDIQLVKENIDREGIELILVMSENEKVNFKKSAYPKLPEKTTVIYTKSDPVKELGLTLSGEKATTYPLFIVVKPNGDIIYKNEGYKIGIGNDLLKKL